MVILSYGTLWTLRPIRGRDSLRSVDIALGELLGTNALFASSSIAIGAVTAIIGIIGAVGVVLALIGAIRRSGILFGLLGVVLFILKFAIVWFR